MRPVTGRPACSWSASTAAANSASSSSCSGVAPFIWGGTAPSWKRVKQLMERMQDAVSKALESTRRIHAYVEEYDKVREAQAAVAEADPKVELVSRSAKCLGQLSPGLDPARYLAVGGAAEVLERIEEYRAAGISKFVLRPLATDAADLEAQTERLIEQVLPAAHALADPAAVEDRAVGT